MALIHFTYCSKLDNHFHFHIGFSYWTLVWAHSLAHKYETGVKRTDCDTTLTYSVKELVHWPGKQLWPWQNKKGPLNIIYGFRFRPYLWKPKLSLYFSLNVQSGKRQIPSPDDTHHSLSASDDH